MSRVAKAPIAVPAGVDVKIADRHMTVKGKLGEMSYSIREGVNVEMADSTINIKWDDSIKTAKSQAGTARALISNMVKGVSEGFVEKMTLIGVGYRAQVKGDLLTLALGYSNPVEYQVPAGITVEAPTQTELHIKGSDKQRVGQVASEIRAFRPPEPYKGKGVRIADEYVARKEAKKK